jgi:hypothetical protein
MPIAISSSVAVAASHRKPGADGAENDVVHVGTDAPADGMGMGAITAMGIGIAAPVVARAILRLLSARARAMRR